MIDIHNHLLPGIDDGAETMEQSLKMVDLFIENGYYGAICTSHYYPGKYEINSVDYDKAFDALKNEISTKGIDFKLYQGNEIFLSQSGVDKLKRKEIKSLNNGKYVLIELPFYSELNSALDLIFQLQLEGYAIVLAHCERYQYFQKDLLKLIPYLKKGCLIQINLSSYRGTSMDCRCLTELLQKKWVSFVATDAHKDTGERSPNVTNELSRLKSVISEEYYRRITTENPVKLIENQPIYTVGDSFIEKEKTKKSFIKKLFGK